MMEVSGMPKPPFTVFMMGESSPGALFLDDTENKNMLREVEASYVKNLTRAGSWKFPE
jgi:hypothetical protein